MQERKEAFDTDYLPDVHFARSLEACKERLGNVPIEKFAQSPLTGNKILDGEKHVMRAKLYMQKNEMKMAVQELSRSADLGNPEGMYLLAVCHHDGRGCPKNLDMTQYWLEEAIKHPRKVGGLRNVGVAEAMHGLALELHDSNDPRDVMKAIEYWTIGSEDGLSQASNSLGAAYENGKGVNQDFRKAEELYKIAAEGGESQAMYNLACLYAKGLSGCRNLKRAILWAQKAVDAGANHARELLVHCKKVLKEEQSMPETARPVFEEILTAVTKYAATPKPKLFVTSGQTFTKEKLESCGSPYCHELLKVCGYLDQVELAIQRQDLPKVLKSFAMALRIPDSGLIISDWSPFTFEDLAALPRTADIALIELHMHKTRGVVAILTKANSCIKEFPSDAVFYDTAGCMYGFQSEWEKSVQAFTKGRSLATSEYEKADFTYLLATSENKGELCRQAEKHYLEFLANCVKGHRKVPESYFNLAEISFIRKDIPMAKEYYLKAIKADEELPDMFKSRSPLKDILAVGLNLSESFSESNTKPSPNKNETSKNPTVSSSVQSEAETIPVNRTCQREVVLNLRGATARQTGYRHNTTQTPPKMSTGRREKSSQPITIEEMMAGKDHVYEKRHITCMVFTLPAKMVAFTFGIVDEQGDIMKLALFNATDPFVHQLTIGCKITIPNPYYRLAANGGTTLRVDNPSFLEIGTVRSCCHYCLKLCQNLQVCNGCKVLKYCGRDCQVADWTDFGHKLDCKHLANLSFIRKK